MSDDDKAERMRLEREHTRLEREYVTNLITLAVQLEPARIPQFRVSQSIGALVRQYIKCPVGPCDRCGVHSPLKEKDLRKVCAWGCLPKLERVLEPERSVQVRTPQRTRNGGLDR